MLWDTVTGEMLRILGGESDPLFELVLLSDELLATGDGGGTIRFWNPQTGLLVHTLSPYRSEVSALTVSPDGTCLATASFDMRVAVFGFPQE
jgi:WD40 repeat protein